MWSNEDISVSLRPVQTRLLELVARIIPFKISIYMPTIKPSLRRGTIWHHHLDLYPGGILSAEGLIYSADVDIYGRSPTGIFA